GSVLITMQAPLGACIDHISSNLSPLTVSPSVCGPTARASCQRSLCRGPVVNRALVGPTGRAGAALRLSIPRDARRRIRSAAVIEPLRDGAAQDLAPSATPTNGAVGSAALNNGYPGAGGAVALPSIANSNTAATTPLAGAATSPLTTSTSSGG